MSAQQVLTEWAKELTGVQAFFVGFITLALLVIAASYIAPWLRRRHERWRDDGFSTPTGTSYGPRLVPYRERKWDYKIAIEGISTMVAYSVTFIFFGVLFLLFQIDARIDNTSTWQLAFFCLSVAGTFVVSYFGALPFVRHAMAPLDPDHKKEKK